MRNPLRVFKSENNKFFKMDFKLDNNVSENEVQAKLLFRDAETGEYLVKGKATIEVNDGKVTTTPDELVKQDEKFFEKVMKKTGLDKGDNGFQEVMKADKAEMLLISIDEVAGNYIENNLENSKPKKEQSQKKSKGISLGM
jgi:hypothetical protein